MTEEATAKGRHKKEIYDYDSPHLVYGMGWSCRKDHSFRLALGSFIEDYANQVEIVELVHDTTTDDWKFEKTGSFEHPYPTTKIMWRPDEQGTEKDQLATTGDYLRLWEVGDQGVIKEKAVFNNVSSRTKLVLTFSIQFRHTFLCKCRNKCY
jgi:WD repeat-containing protein 68